MTEGDQPDEALAAIEQAILPHLSLLLDGALDAAALARPGTDAEDYAAGLRRTAGQLGDLAALLAAVRPLQAAVQPLRMSA